MTSPPRTIPLAAPPPASPEEVARRARAFYDLVRTRRSVREFSPRPVSRRVVEDLLRAAATAPSGAHRQPWRFVAVSDPALKRRIREAAEREERESYEHRMTADWLADLAPLGTDWRKPFLETAPWLIAVFRVDWEHRRGKRLPNYYVHESVGLACGLLLAAVHHAGLVALTHTPSPMGFLREILGRPWNEKPFLLIPVGHAAPEARVPDLERATLEDIAWFHEPPDSE
ncbi:MAG: nitroreductase family protein [Gemmatimonadota bacterium]